MTTSNHDTGKKGEKASEVYMSAHGFKRADKKLRADMESRYKKAGYSIQSTAFDYVKVSELDDALPTLYELKTAGEKRKTEVGDDWNTFGFTYTEKEERNAKLLGKKYKFIFLDLKKKRHIVLNERDWLNETNARIYQTKSIFIKGLDV